MPKIPILRQKINPLIGGCQIQNKIRKGKGIGTLACVVYDNKTKIPLGLTNRHILVGDIDSSVIQPCNRARTDEFIVGNVLRKGGGHWSTDYAVFKINLENRQISENSIFGLEGIISEYIDPEVGMLVQKVGQYTGHTYGVVSNVNEENETFTIKPNQEKMEGLGQISMGGDSGSLWVTDEVNPRAVGLHARGEKQPRFLRRRKPDRATAIFLSKVMKDLSIKLNNN